MDTPFFTQKMFSMKNGVSEEWRPTIFLGIKTGKLYGVCSVHVPCKMTVREGGIKHKRIWDVQLQCFGR